MAASRAIQAEVKRLQGLFEAAGAVPVDTDVLQPADILLDLYGEDIRARAFVTHDPLRGEYMLRPDFTVPVVQMHMAGGAEPARYTYSGLVFRQHEDSENRTNETIQVGYEVFDRSNPIKADAEVFALFAKALAGVDTHVITGDIGILKAAVLGLETTHRRKAALLRHIWRPQRFRELLDRYSGKSPVPPARSELLADAAPLEKVGNLNGLRGLDEIAERIEVLREDAKVPPISKEEIAQLECILELNGSFPDVIVKLRELADHMPALQASVAGMGARLDSLDRQGIDICSLTFEGNFGRTSMEYYDGFVFGFYLKNDAGGPPVASGGRYDALTQVLGRGKSIPAVGGVIRPSYLMGLQP